jgi:hemolysin III
MMKRTKLADRALPVYSLGEELVNTATHALGGVLGVVALILCVRKAWLDRGAAEITGAAIYGA